MAQRTISRRSRRDDDYDEDYTDDQTTPDSAEEEDDRPRRGRSRSSRDEDEAPARGRSRRSREADEDDEPPARSRRTFRTSSDDEEKSGPRRPIKSTVGRGWGGLDSIKDIGSDYVKTWKVPTKPTLIKFLDGDPFSTFAEHWLDERKGKRSFVCLGEDCPLCDDLGDRPSGYALFNILDLTDPDNPKVEVWKCGKRVAGMLRNFAEDKKTSPLNRVDLYWSIFKSGEKGGNVQTNLNPVKARDLLEDWDCEPFTEEELAEFETRLHTEDQVVTISPRKELKAVAEDYGD